MLFTAHNPAVIDGLDLQDDRIRLFVVVRDNLGHSRAKRVTITFQNAVVGAIQESGLTGG